MPMALGRLVEGSAGGLGLRGSKDGPGGFVYGALFREGRSRWLGERLLTWGRCPSMAIVGNDVPIPTMGAGGGLSQARVHGGLPRKE